MKVELSNAELPANLDMIAKLAPGLKGLTDGIKSKMTGMQIVGTLTITETITPTEHATLAVTLTP